MTLERPKPHSAREIRERREKVLLLMSRGYNQTDIAKELGTTRQTVIRDMKNIYEMTNRGLFNLAKVTLPTMFFNCVQGLDELLKECWCIYNGKYDGDKRSINTMQRVAILRLANDIMNSKFNIFTNGPAMMEIGKLHDELEILKRETLGDNYSNKFTSYKRSLASSHRYHGPSAFPYSTSSSEDDLSK
jgi:hypothetical protein